MMKIIETIFEKFRRMPPLFGIKRIYGPKKIDYGKNELIVVCLMNNGEPCIKEFIEHYFSLGVKHIVFHDNNSSDNSLKIARNYGNITFLKSNLPVKEYWDECRLKNHLIRHFGRKDRWCLCANIDEFFDYPCSDILNLSMFLEYLNKNSYNAVVTQMLDMFPDKQLNKSKSLNEHKYYDISNIQKKDYFNIDPELVKGNRLSNREIKRYLGGIRKTVFNTNNWLTKHSLVFLDSKINPIVNPHYANNAECADITAVFYHYKFHNNFIKSSRDYIRRRLFLSCICEYKNYAKKMKENPAVILKQKTSKKLKNVNELLRNGFLVVSEKYKKYVAEIKDFKNDILV